MILYKALLYTHILAGFAGLTTFWLPAFSKKGGKLHRRSGRWYVRFMWVVVITAAMLCIQNVWIGEVVQGIFLGFISLITANPLWYGIAVLRQKKEFGQSFIKMQRAFRLCIIFAAVLMLGYGRFVIPENDSVILLYIFGFIGLADLPNLLRELMTKERNDSWLQEHLVGMFSTGIAAFTAFLVFGANNFLGSMLSGYWAVIPWVLPTIVGTIAITSSKKRWKQKAVISG